MSIGSTWNKLRIGVRIAVNGSATVVGTPIFAMGVCSGTGNPFNNGAASTDHFVGATTRKSTWAYSAGFFYINSGTDDWVPTKRVGTTATLGSQMNLLVLPAVSEERVWILFLDITKGSPNYTLQSFYSNNTLVPHITREQFLETVEIEAATLSNHAWGTAQTLAVDEGADGALNAVNLAWDRAIPQIEISDVAIVRFS